MYSRALVSVACCAAAFSGAASFVAPDTGSPMDRSFTVTLATEVPRECVAWVRKGPALDVQIGIDKSWLRQRAELHPQLRAGVQKLLAASNREPGVSGCVELETIQSTWIGMFHSALEAGAAVVMNGPERTLQPHVVVRFYANTGGGVVTYRVPDGQRPIAARQWWVR